MELRKTFMRSYQCDNHQGEDRKKMLLKVRFNFFIVRNKLQTIDIAPTL